MREGGNRREDEQGKGRREGREEKGQITRGKTGRDVKEEREGGKGRREGKEGRDGIHIIESMYICLRKV